MSRVLVLGAGVSGLAAGRLARALGMSPTLYTEAPAPEALGAGLPVVSGAWDPLLLTGMDLVVASPGFSERSLPVVESLEAGLPVWSEIEFAWRQLNVPVVAVSGTNGKTTVTEATAAMLAESGLTAPTAGNIGSALSDHVGEPCDLIVIEVSSFQLRFIDEFRPDAAALTNVAVDHLDWHGSAASYRAAKAMLFRNQGPEDVLVYDADDEGASTLVTGARSRLLPVSGRRLPPGGGGVDRGRLTLGDFSIDVETVSSTDPVHLVNLVTAAALAMHMGAATSGVERVAARFVPGAHRRTVVARGGGVVWIDDSKATNTHAALASIRSHESVILIAGGLPKGLDLTPLAAEPGVRLLLGIGTAGPALVGAAGDRGVLAGTLERAVEIAAELAMPGDTVLLAPGGASFDQFRSYAERGDIFARLVREVLEERTRT